MNFEGWPLQQATEIEPKFKKNRMLSGSLNLEGFGQGFGYQIVCRKSQNPTWKSENPASRSSLRKYWNLVKPVQPGINFYSASDLWEGSTAQVRGRPAVEPLSVPRRLSLTFIHMTIPLIVLPYASPLTILPLIVLQPKKCCKKRTKSKENHPKCRKAYKITENTQKKQKCKIILPENPTSENFGSGKELNIWQTIVWGGRLERHYLDI